MTKNELIDAIKLIMEHGCNGIECEECPLDDATGTSIEKDLCLSITSMRGKR